MSRNLGVADAARIEAFSRIVVVIIIVASCTRAGSSVGVVHVWISRVCGVGVLNSGIGQWIASIATMWWFSSEEKDILSLNCRLMMSNWLLS